LSTISGAVYCQKIRLWGEKSVEILLERGKSESVCLHEHFGKYQLKLIYYPATDVCVYECFAPTLGLVNPIQSAAFE